MAQYRVGRLQQEIQREVDDILLKRVRVILEFKE